jgi:hypothetical protein
MEHLIKTDCKVTKTGNGQLESLPKWRDRKGSFHDISSMETRHLFYTVRMIWNHTSPSDLQLKPFKKYSFSKFYTQEYFAKMVKAMLIELSKRNDLTWIWVNELNFMIGHQLRIK